MYRAVGVLTRTHTATVTHPHLLQLLHSLTHSCGRLCLTTTLLLLTRVHHHHGRQVFTLTGVSCWRCGKRGHLTKDCSQPDARPCVFCARYGHEGIDCPDSE